jgi:hypothetical protein
MADVNPMAAYMQDLMNTGPNDHGLGLGTDGVGGLGDDYSQAGDFEDEAAGNITQEAIDPGLNRVGHGPPRMGSVGEICRQLKQRKTFSSESQAELDIFAASLSAMFSPLFTNFFVPSESTLRRRTYDIVICSDP